MEAISIILALVTPIAIVAFCIGLLMLLFKRWRSKAKWVVIISFVAALVSPFVGMKADNIAKEKASQAAIALGFIDAADHKRAKRNGYNRADDWNANKDRIEAEEQVNLKRWEAERIKKALDNTRREIAEENKVKAQQQGALDKEQAVVDERKAKAAAKTITMAQGIAKAIERHYASAPEGDWDNGQYCRQDGYCSMQHGPFSIRVLGRGVVDIPTSNQASHLDYIELCIVTFSATSGSAPEFATDVVGQAFGIASKVGRLERDVSGVKIKIYPDSGNIMRCEFFKY